MIPKIKWPDTSHFDKGNPFGGVDGFRPLRITFHNSSFTNITGDFKKALDILVGLARLDDIDAMSFDGSVGSKILIESDRGGEEYIPLKIINTEGEATRFSGVSRSYIEPSYMAYLLGIYSSNEDEKYRPIRQEILEAYSHDALHRDIFVTSSVFLLEKRKKLEELNIYTPKDALKIVGLYLRMKGEFEWTSHIAGNAQYVTSRQAFYDSLSRGLLPNIWKYLSGLGQHNERERLLPLGWSVLDRYSRVLQARDEMGRLFYMQEPVPKTSRSQDQIAYHFDYLTLLLTAILDAQALIINGVYGYGLKDQSCGLRRDGLRKAIEKDPATSNLNTLLAAQDNFLNILFDLRNKIHSTSLKTDFHVPESYPDKLLERIYQYEPVDHWGVQKQNVTVTINRGPLTPSIDYSVDLYNLAYGLVNETTKLINSLMEETKIKAFLDPVNLSKIVVSPPADMLPFIETYLLLAGGD